MAPTDILVVDDDPKNLLAIQSVFADLGRRVVTAPSGREGLRHLLVQDFALILLDVQMPEMDGFQTAELIRARRRNEHTPIIFVTAHDQSEREVLRGYRLGAVDFLFKPIVPEVLEAKAAVFVALQEKTEAVRRQAEQLHEMQRRESMVRLAEERRAWEADRLREESRRKDEFLAVLAHELRNPLATIVAGLALMEELGLPGEDFDAAHRSMGRQAGHLVRLVDDLLNVSRISRGKVHLAREIIDLRDVLRDALDGQAPAFDTGDRHVTVVMPPQPVHVSGDHVRLVQVFTNILTNATQHTEHGGHIEVVLACVDDRAVVSIRDDGEGISSPMLGRLFDLFEQASGESGGLGLGLAIADQLVELHGGTISAESAGLGEGSTFTVELAIEHLPAATAAPAPVPRLRDYRVTPRGVGATVDSEDAHGPCRIAIVEDDADARDVLKALLEAWGYTVEVAEDGAAGVDLVVAHRPDIVLMDVGMPRMDGYEAARRIRAHMQDATPTLVAMTGYGTARDRQLALDAGFEDHLTKPVYPDALRAVLGRGLQP